MFKKICNKNILIGALCLFGAASSASAALIVNPPLSITNVVNIQPIIVSDTDGLNTAEYFADQQVAIETLVDTIWAQAGIDINFLSANSWNNTFANWGPNGAPDNGGLTRSTSDLNTIVADGAAAGVANADTSVINMYFVNISAGFGLLSENSAAGLAFVGGNGITQYIGTNLLSFASGRDVVSSVVSHEIGHNLGLDHLVETENLMQQGGAANPGERLNASQINTVLSSQFVAPVPLPPALFLMLSGLGLFGLFKRKQLG